MALPITKARRVAFFTKMATDVAILGIFMRMLNVLECQRAMGFPDSYRLPVNRKLAKHLLGNAVPPVMVTDALRDLKERL